MDLNASDSDDANGFLLLDEFAATASWSAVNWDHVVTWSDVMRRGNSVFELSSQLPSYQFVFERSNSLQYSILVLLILIWSGCVSTLFLVPLFLSLRWCSPYRRVSLQPISILLEAEHARLMFIILSTHRGYRRTGGRCFCNLPRV